MIYQPGDMRGVMDEEPAPAAAKVGPPQCARGCGWINDYAEPGFVCRKCQLWEGIIEPGEPSAVPLPWPPATKPTPAPSASQPHAPGAQAQCTGCGVVHALGSPCGCSFPAPPCPRCQYSRNVWWGQSTMSWYCDDCGYCW